MPIPREQFCNRGFPAGNLRGTYVFYPAYEEEENSEIFRKTC